MAFAGPIGNETGFRAVQEVTDRAKAVGALILTYFKYDRSARGSVVGGRKLVETDFTQRIPCSASLTLILSFIERPGTAPEPFFHESFV